MELYIYTSILWLLLPDEYKAINPELIYQWRLQQLSKLIVIVTSLGAESKLCEYRWTIRSAGLCIYGL